jgi:hypothetical protein
MPWRAERHHGDGARRDVVADRVETRHGRVGGAEMVLDLNDGVVTGIPSRCREASRAATR